MAIVTKLNLKKADRPLGFAAKGLFLGLLLLSLSVADAAIEIYPRVSGSLLYSDNLNRASASNERFADVVLDFQPGVALDHRSLRWTSDASVDLQFLKYARAVDADDIFLQLNANTQGELIRDRLFLNAFTAFGQGNVDARESTVISNDNLTSGRTNIFTANVEPTWIQPLGSLIVSEATAGYGIATFPGGASGNDPADDASLVDSEIFNLSWVLRSPTTTERYFWNLGYYEDQIKYETDQKDRLKRVSLDMGFLITTHFQLVGLIGQEDNRFERNTTDSISGFYWNSGFRWNASARNSMEFRFGRRPEIGDTYLFNWNFTGQRLGMEAGYIQDYSATARRINQFANPDNAIPGLEEDLPSIRPDAFLRKNLNFGATYATLKTSLGFGGFNERRLYQLGAREHVIGFDVNVSRRLSAVSRLLASASWRDQELVDGDAVVLGFYVAYSRRFGRSWFLRPSYSRRSGDDSGIVDRGNVIENRVMIELIWDLRPDADSLILD